MNSVMRFLARFLTRPKHAWQAVVIYLGLLCSFAAAAEAVLRYQSVRVFIGMMLGSEVVNRLVRRASKDAEREAAEAEVRQCMKSLIEKERTTPEIIR
jgi:hypothetical protein